MATRQKLATGSPDRALQALDRAVAFAEHGAADAKVVLVSPEDLRTLPAGEVRSRLDRLIIAPHADLGLDALLSASVLDALLPEVKSMVGFGDGEFRHKDVWKHTKQVVTQAEPRLEVRWSALFHDIGKLHGALSDIFHEQSKLTPEERRAVRTHPQRGAEVLAPLSAFYPDLGKGVAAHHERWDGTGYPRGLKGKRIPLVARVVAIADSFDAITYRRRYSHARSFA